MNVEIRRARPNDAEALALVGKATFLETYAGLLPAADILAHCAREHSAERYAGWLAGEASQIWLVEVAQGRAPVGYAVAGEADLPVPTAADDLELKRFYLLGRLHGQGVASRLMLDVMAGAGEAGARRMLVGVFSANARALAFYRRQGFTQAGVRKFRVGQGLYDDLVLTRTVT